MTQSCFTQYSFINYRGPHSFLAATTTFPITPWLGGQNIYNTNNLWWFHTDKVPWRWRHEMTWLAWTVSRTYISSIWKPTPSCLLLNELRLFILTQNSFILIQIVTFTCVLHVSACTEVIFSHVNTKKNLPEKCNKNLKGLVDSHYF